MNKLLRIVLYPLAWLLMCFADCVEARLELLFDVMDEIEAKRNKSC